MIRISLVILSCFCLIFNACERTTTKPHEPPEKKEEILPLTQVPRGAFPDFTDTRDLEALTHSISQSLKYFNRVPKTREYTYGNETYTAEHMIRSMETLAAFLVEKPSPSGLAEFIRSHYRVYASAANADRQVLFTGYYEPTYAGSLEKTGPFVHPLYTPPSDILDIDLSLFSETYKGHKRLRARVKGNRVVPYYSRGEINGMADFETRSQPLLWLKSRVDRFFLEVQGSGRISLPNKDIVRVHYAGSNGNPYRSVGRYLIRQNEVPKEKMSMQAIRKWLEANPGRMDEVLHYNKSFVFFKTETGGPFGSINVELTPFRSIATDRKIFPNGALCFIKTALPQSMDQASVTDWQPTAMFVLNQDTGGAIRGPGRADLFCGSDAYAEFTAGHMNVRGELYFLVLAP